MRKLLPGHVASPLRKRVAVRNNFLDAIDSPNLAQSAEPSFLRKQKSSARQRFRRSNFLVNTLLIAEKGTPCHCIPACAEMTIQRFFSRIKHFLLVLFTAFSPLLLTGCATVGESVVGKVASAAMESVGLKKSDSSETKKVARTVQISLNAGSNLNASHHQPLAVVVKIYQLKNANTFMQAPLNILADAAAEKAFLGADLVEQHDMTLLPGQHYAVAEKVSGEVNEIGVVALFHSPAPRRWKFVFDAASAEKTGIKLGIHACAMTVVAGEVRTPPGTRQEQMQEEALNQLALVKCL